MKKTALVIMAAGLGSRFGGGIKQLTRFGAGGELIIDFTIYDALRAGFDEIVFVIRRELEADFCALIGDRTEKHCTVRYVYQDKSDLPGGYTCPPHREKPWGTGHAVLACRSVLDCPFAVLNADDYYGPSTLRIIHDALLELPEDGSIQGCMAGFILRNTLSDFGGVTRAVCQVEDGMLMGIQEVFNIEKTELGAESVARDGERSVIPLDSTISMNIWGFTPAVFDALESEFHGFLGKNIHSRNAEFVLPTFVGRMIRAGRARVAVLPTAERWFGVTYREDVPAVKQAFADLFAAGVYPEPLPTARVIRTAIAGFGLSGTVFQAPFLHADPRFEFVKVYERRTNRAEQEYPYVQTVRSFDELLTDDIDLVIISTPNDTHVPMAKKAMLAGKHVVVEKPVAATSAEALELCELAKQQGVLFTVYQNRRLDSDFLTVKKLIEEGALGEVVDYEAHYDRFERGVNPKPWKAVGGEGVGVLYDLGVHIIDQAYCLFGMPKEVYADFRQQRPESPGIDNFEVILYYDTVRAILAAGELVTHQGPHFMVNGRRGTFIKYGEDVQEKALLAGKRPPQPDWDVEGPEAYGTLWYDEDGEIKETKVPTVVSGYGAYYDNLYRALTADAPLLVPPAQTADVLRIIEAAKRSNEEKRRIAL